jgi:hypothetical protein
MASRFSLGLVIGAAIVVTGTQLATAQPNQAAEMVGLTPNNTLVMFDSSNPTTIKDIKVSEIEGRLIGIDIRPANGMLYGVTDTSKIYTIDSATGKATLVSTLSIPFKGGMRSGVDFNPVADRLRLVGANGQNFRINVETGAVTNDGALAYASGDKNARSGASISAGAYTNSMAGAKTTQLFNIDTVQDSLVLQSPPNDGVLKTIGSLGTDFISMAGMDIVSDGNGGNMAFAVSGSTLYSINLEKGAAQSIGTIGNSNMSFIDLAAMPKAK